ncbi:ABC transporter substrate-binding protein [Tuberibacillus sp. Marseille-P3662]|uniref:ABC transporter substrate-binding protein n=1 Tax=Tuberibacillus sp. Marseille-P3662 TaxID=1965358 RepID=UPI000A1C9238|nr:ABC transporter substrate-binding protein [Tuberibacillus sp. Marseille-P3662]
MKQSTLLLKIAAFLFILVFTVGCSEQTKDAKDLSSRQQQQLLQDDWQSILTKAKGQSVNFYLWGGNESTNRYIDEWVAPRLKEQFGVNLNRVPVNDIKDTTHKLLAEKQAGKKNGSVDMMWINGENFLTAKDNELLWGPFSPRLPNVKKYVDQNAPAINYDFGEPTKGLEAPWSQAQFVLTYDQSKVKHPPTSAEALKQWVEKHPGKFTYSAPPDFTGSAFVRNMLYETTGGYQQYLKPIDEQKNLNETLKPLWNYLNDIEPHLWRNGQTYPESASKLDQLYASGSVWMTMSYSPAHAANEVKTGRFPKSTRTLVLKDGTLANTSYLSIPFNAQHKAAAMVAINFMLSPDAQIAKANPDNWGALTAIDPNRLSDGDQKRLNAIDRGQATLSAKGLAHHRVPEMPAAYVDTIEKGWLEHVAKR